jgi:hypothetical protein
LFSGAPLALPDAARIFEIGGMFFQGVGNTFAKFWENNSQK